MNPPDSGNYAKSVGLKVSEEEHQKLKLLAVREKKTIKAVLFEGLDKAFPGWRGNTK